MRRLWDTFWNWYDKHLTLNITISAGLFVLQLVHLTWLGLHVIAFKLIGQSLWDPNLFWQNIIILVDYTEIPVIFSVSLIYINEIRKNGFKIKPVFYITTLYIQLIHILWITDEFVLTTFTGEGPIVPLPAWLAWIAILIDYLELPVIIETMKKLIYIIKKGHYKELSKVLKDR